MKVQPENSNMPTAKTSIAEQKPASMSPSLTAEGMKQTPVQAQTIKDMLTDALAASGFSTSKENIKLAMMLMEKSLPVNKETLTAIKQAMVLFGADNEAKALLLVLNSIKPNESTANMLNSYISGDVSLLGGLKNIANIISEIDDPKLKMELLKAALGNQSIRESKTLNSQTPASSEIFNISESEVRIDIGTAKKAFLNSLDVQTLIKSTSKELTDILLENKAAGTETAHQSFEKAISQIITKLPSNLTVSANSEAVTKNIMQEIKAGYSTNELFKLTANHSEAEGLKAPLHSIIEDELAKLLLTAENKAIGSTDTVFKALFGAGGIRATDRGTAVTDITKALSFDLKNTTSKDLNDYLNNLRDRLELIRQVISESPPTEANQRLLREAVTMYENLNFFTHMKNNMFLQLPLHINEHFTNAELYIMKDRRVRNQKDSNSHSALIAIDTGSLGRFEAYVQKDMYTVNIQFRIETEFAESLIKANIEKLGTALEQYGYRLDNCMYKHLTEAFTLEDTVKNDEIFGQEPIDFDNAVVFDMKG